MLDDVREWISDNLIYILIGAGALAALLVIIGIFRLVGGSKKSPDESTKETVKVEQTTEDTAANGTAAAEFVSDLIEDDTAVLTLVKQYYTAIKSGDTTTLSEIMDPWDANVERDTLANKVIEDYQNIHTHSKAGLNEGEYVVYTYYEAKMANIETMAPTLVAQYVKTAEDGTLKMYTMNSDDAVKTYVTEASAQPDVQALITEVRNKYENALRSDSALKEYIDTLDTNGSTSDDEETAVGGQMATTSDLNVRAEASTDSSIVAVVLTGTVVNVLETAEDGWVQISYDAQGGTVTGYVKSEYLAAAPSTSDTAA